MDYVIAGLGFGAVLAIIGFLLTELGGSRRSSIPRWVATAGSVLMFAALILWAVTAAAFFSGLDDDMALRVVAGSGAVATLGALVAVVVIARTHRPRTTAATSGVAIQVERTAALAGPVGTVVSEPEVKKDEVVGAAETVQPAAEIETGAQDEPEAEKNWPEIWRQTWGSESVPESEPAAEPAQVGEDAEPAPIDETVLQSWGAALETSEELESAPDQREDGDAESDSEPRPLEDGSPLVATSESFPDNDETTATSDLTVDSVTKAPEPGIEESEGSSLEPGSPNGNNPEGGLEGPVSEVDLANARSRDQG